jgi:GR25 family glycosyltransferase involved in LPS biosynthesis
MNEAEREPIVFVALLVKQKGLILPMWLKSMSEWDYPKERMILYIRSNNNTDHTQEVLRDWINENRQYYRLVIEDYKDVVENVEKYGVHEWNAVRFKVLGRIRNESLRIASSTKSDFYWVVDVDNFIKPHTLSKMVSHNLPVVAPFLKCADTDSPAYSNYHFVTDARGYYLDDSRYHQILRQEIKGLVLCDVVHCTYLIRRDFFEKITYTDGTVDYEYVIFSRNLRNLGVPQYFDNQEVYGFLTLKDDVDGSVNALKHLNTADSTSADSTLAKDYFHKTVQVQPSSKMVETCLNIHVITLRTSLKRQAEFKSNHPFLDYEWFEAVTPEDFSREDLVRLNLIDSSINWKSTSIANALSHKALWEKALASNQNLIIMEDDVHIATDFWECLTPLLKDVGDNFDILLLGCNWDRFLLLEMFPGESGLVKLQFNQSALQNEIDIVRFNQVRSNAYRLSSAFGNCGYVISPKGAALMIESVFPLGERLVNRKGVESKFNAQSKDALMCLVYPESASYVAFPPLVYVANNHSESTLHNGPKLS